MLVCLGNVGSFSVSTAHFFAPNRLSLSLAATLSLSSQVSTCFTYIYYYIMEEVQARHRKELKTLEGEHRAAVKKTKASKGKKAKEDVSA